MASQHVSLDWAQPLLQVSLQNFDTVYGIPGLGKLISVAMANESTCEVCAILVELIGSHPRKCTPCALQQTRMILDKGCPHLTIFHGTLDKHLNGVTTLGKG